MLKFLLTFILLMSSLLAFSQTSRVVSGKIRFSIKYWAGTCEGSFSAPQGTVKFDATNLATSSINVSVSAASFNTGNSMRDKDVRDEKYLNATAHPTITFKSSTITAKGGMYYADGTLTIKGVSRKISIPFKAAKRSGGGFDISSSFSINRLAYNVGKDGATMKDLVSLNISAIVK
jgi:polyisoprenoid-binding protein YceI